MSFQIIGTIGPSSIDPEVLQRLVAAKLDCFRINLSHSNEALLNSYYNIFKENNISPSIDTQGAQIRVCELLGKTHFEVDEYISISCLDDADLDADIRVNHAEFFEQIQIGDIIKIGFDGLIVSISDIHTGTNKCLAKVVSSGEISLNKALDISGKSIDLHSFTEFDKAAISCSAEHGVDTIFLSFCDSVDAIESARLLSSSTSRISSSNPKIVAKIENKKGLINLPEIAQASDGILIDRGDLSREISISSIPSVVHSIINTCNTLSTPCYVATNVLDSMIVDDLPSRAEISDIYNLLTQGVSGFVLAAEMAIGSHPVESVQILSLMKKLYDLEARSLSSLVDIELLEPGLPPYLKAWL